MNIRKHKKAIVRTHHVLHCVYWIEATLSAVAQNVALTGLYGSLACLTLLVAILEETDHNNRVIE